MVERTGAAEPEPRRRVELFGSAACPYTAECRERLEWEGREFVEYDVERDPAALVRLHRLTGGGRTVPVLVEDGRVVAIGWQGRGCTVSPPAAEER
ncbi:MAG: glutathione S-transferase N-terminal domain-containing protein [Gemmatimonadales bacterium]|nr:glutathione S-transferase N-terminal domain-containing protein [Gemmatimonadales bacterium]